MKNECFNVLFFLFQVSALNNFHFVGTGKLEHGSYMTYDLYKIM